MPLREPAPLKHNGRAESLIRQAKARDFKTIAVMEKVDLTGPAQATAKAQRRYRRFPRYRFDVRIQVSVFRDGVTVNYWGRANELGQDGIGATVSGELQSGEVVSLEFPILLPPENIKLRAVVRYNDGLRCGFEFLVLTDEQRMLIQQICASLTNA
jgi:hypothetical protein